MGSASSPPAARKPRQRSFGERCHRSSFGCRGRVRGNSRPRGPAVADDEVLLSPCEARWSGRKEGVARTKPRGPNGAPRDNRAIAGSSMWGRERPSGRPRAPTRRDEHTARIEQPTETLELRHPALGAFIAQPLASAASISGTGWAATAASARHQDVREPADRDPK